MRTDCHDKHHRTSALRLVTLVTALGVVVAPHTSLATPPPGYTETVVREVEHGTEPSDLFITDGQAEGESDFGPACFAVDASGNWCFPDPQKSASRGGREAMAGKVKVFPPAGPARILTCHTDVDANTELDVTSSGVLVVAPMPDRLVGGAGNMFCLILPDGEERLVFISPTIAGPGSPQALHVLVTPAERNAAPFADFRHEREALFPEEAKKGELAGLTVRGLWQMPSEDKLSIDPEGGLYVEVSCMCLDPSSGRPAHDPSTGGPIRAAALCRFDLDGNLTSKSPASLRLNRQGCLMSLIPARERPPKRRPNSKPYELILYAVSGKVETVVGPAVPESGRLTPALARDAGDFVPCPSRTYLDSSGRIYLGPLSLFDSPDQFRVHIYSPNGEYLGSGSWPKGTIDIRCARQIEVDNAGNIYFLQFGEESVKLMKWTRQEGAQ